MFCYCSSLPGTTISPLSSYRMGGGSPPYKEPPSGVSFSPPKSTVGSSKGAPHLSYAEGLRERMTRSRSCGFLNGKCWSSKCPASSPVTQPLLPKWDRVGRYSNRPWALLGQRSDGHQSQAAPTPAPLHCMKEDSPRGLPWWASG